MSAVLANEGTAHAPSHATLIAAVHGTATERVELARLVLASRPSSWRSEALQVLYRVALERGEPALATTVEATLPGQVVLEERIVCRAGADAEGALADDGFALLSVAGQRRVLHVCMQQLGKRKAQALSSLATALRGALDWLSPASAFGVAIQLAGAYATLCAIDDEHLVSLSTVATPSEAAHDDLARAIAAARVARGSAVQALPTPRATAGSVSEGGA
jgi:hypothetical protein